MAHIADLIHSPNRQLDAAQTIASIANESAHQPAVEQSIDAIKDMLETVRGHLDMDVAFISRQIGTTHRVFTHVSNTGKAPLCEGDTNQNDNSLCWLVIEGRLPERVCDTSEYAVARDLPVVEALNVRSHFSVPMKRRDGSVHGSLCCFSHRPRHEINERDMKLLRSAAAIVSDQIESRIEREESRELAEREIIGAITKNELTVHHQPIYEIEARALVGYECLLRRVSRADALPQSLFADADTANRRFELEMHAASQALKTMCTTQEDQFITVNASPSTIISDAFWSLIPPGLNNRLIVEVTEEQAIEDYDAVKQAMDRMKEKAWVAIDDVGAGFAGLQHLMRLDPDILKIDGEIIHGIAHDPARRAIAKALVEFARETDCALIAEGVETKADLNAIQELGIRFAQGYLLGRPAMPMASRLFC